MGKSALASSLQVYGLFYCTEVLRIDPQAAGLIIMMSLAWDAIFDPLIGLWADRHLANQPTVVGPIMFGMPLVAALFLAFFHLKQLPNHMQIVSAVVVLIAFRAAYALIDVPHNSLLIFAARDSTDRMRLASLRILFSALGSVGLTITAAWWFSQFPTEPASAMSRTALVMTLVFIGTWSICIDSMRTILVPRFGIASTPWRPIASLRAMFRSAPDLRIAYFLTAINSSTIPIISVSLIYVSKYQLNNVEIGAKSLIIQSLLQSITPFVWERLSQRGRSVTASLVLAYAGLLSCMAAVCLLPLSYISLYFLAGGSGAMIAGINMLNWVFFSDALAAARERVEADMTLGAFGLYSITNKIGHGAAQAISGAIIAFGISGARSVAEQQYSAFLHVLLLTVVGAGAFSALLILRKRRRQAALT